MRIKPAAEKENTIHANIKLATFNASTGASNVPCCAGSIIA
ncbi:hypothetical protein [Thalassotalea sp. PLHSN55]